LNEDLVFSIISESTFEEKMQNKVAPSSLIRKDFDNLKSRESLDTSTEVGGLILIQSIEGRAHNGAGSFGKVRYVNTKIDDIVEALGYNALEIKQKRQALIDEIFEFARRAVSGEHTDRLINRKGAPFLRIPFFAERNVNQYDILRGLYLGAMRDSARVRKTAEEKYNTSIGFGKCYLIDTRVMEEMELDDEILSHQEHMDKIEFYEKMKLIISDEKRLGSEDSIRYQYIRHKLGPGQSDDAAIIAGGMLYNADVALGIFLSDAIDTLEKYVVHYRDQDEELALYVAQRYTGLAVSEDEVLRLTYLAAVPEDDEDRIPDSSLRYLIVIDDASGYSTLENHLSFVQGKPFYPMVISYKRILVSGFYRYMRDKVARVLEPSLITVRELAAKTLQKSAGEVMDRRVIVVKNTTPLLDVLEELRQKKARIIVVKDDSESIVGAIEPQNFLDILSNETKVRGGKDA
jgi:CBS domain-containing protein